jgi:hypothetical protein
MTELRKDDSLDAGQMNEREPAGPARIEECAVLDPGLIRQTQPRSPRV